MARTDTTTTLKAFFAAIPGTILGSRSTSPNDLMRVHIQTLRNLALTALQRDASRVDSGLVPSSPTTASTTALYRCDLSQGLAKVAGLWATHDALADAVQIGSGQWAGGAYALDGSDAVVLSAGSTAWLAVVAVRVTAGHVLCAVMGDAAQDGAEVEITDAQIRTALDAALAATPAGVLVGLNTESFLVLARYKVQRTTKVTWTIGGTVAENDTFAITCNDIESEITADSDDVAADIAGKLRTDLGTELVAEDVTVSGTGADVVITADTGKVFTFSEDKSSAAGTITPAQADTLTQTVTNSLTDSDLLNERCNGTRGSLT